MHWKDYSRILHINTIFQWWRKIYLLFFCLYWWSSSITVFSLNHNIFYVKHLIYLRLSYVCEIKCKKIWIKSIYTVYASTEENYYIPFNKLTDISCHSLAIAFIWMSMYFVGGWVFVYCTFFHYYGHSTIALPLYTTNT